MGQINSRRDGSAAPAAGPAYGRRRGRDRRAAPPHHLRLVHGRTSAPRGRHVAPHSMAGPSLRQETPRPPLRRLLLRALRHNPPAWQHALECWQGFERRTRQQFAGAQTLLRAMIARARENRAELALSSSTPLFPRDPAPGPVAGPSLRQDSLRPPLRALLLRRLRDGALAWRGGRDRWQAAQPGLRRRRRELALRMAHRQRALTAAVVAVVDARLQAAERFTRRQLAAAQVPLRRAAARIAARAAPVIAQALAQLDAQVLQPALWPFRPAQREVLARASAALAVAIAVTGWTALYVTLTPTAKPAARAATPSKQFTARVVPRALPATVMQTAAAPAVAAGTTHDGARDAAAPATDPPQAKAVRKRDDAQRAMARATEGDDATARTAGPRKAAAPVRPRARRAAARKAAPAAPAPRTVRAHTARAAAY